MDASNLSHPTHQRKTLSSTNRHNKTTNGIGSGRSKIRSSRSSNITGNSGAAGSITTTRIDNKRKHPLSQSLLDLSQETKEKRRRMIVEIALLRMEIRRKEKAQEMALEDDEEERANDGEEGIGRWMQEML